MLRRTEIAIDPNVRVRGNLTYAGFEDVLQGHLRVGDTVVVRELEGQLEGTGRITEIDAPKELVYLHVDWATLTHHSEAVGSSIFWAQEPPAFRVLLGESVYLPYRLADADVFTSRLAHDESSATWALAR